MYKYILCTEPYRSQLDTFRVHHLESNWYYMHFCSRTFSEDRELDSGVVIQQPT